MAEKKPSSKTEKTASDPAMGVAPTFANHVRVSVIGAFTRISFGEKYQDSEETFHSAVVIPTAVAHGLAEMIPQVIEENQRANEPAQGDAEGSSSGSG